MAITLEQAKELRPGDMLHHVINLNADKTPQRWKVNGQPKTWKRSPDRVKVPLKHGLYAYGYLEEDDLDLVCLTAKEALEVAKIDVEKRYKDLRESGIK